MSSEDQIDYKQSIIKGILGSQILSVPFSCTLSAIVIILAARFISKTSSSQNIHTSFSVSDIQSIRLLFSKIGAFFVAFVCVAMTAMELAIVYQSAVIHPGDINYLMRAPWTSSLVPLLTALVSIATQTYFSDKTCHVVQCPKLFVPLLVILGIGSLVTGIAASVSLFTIGVERGDQITSSEGVFWSYLVITTLSSFVIMIPLLSSYFRDTKVSRIEASRKANTLKGPTKFSKFMRFFFSTYTMVFLFDLSCLITSILSASPIFQVSLKSSEAFLVLQKMMVRIMSISYLWALVDGIPKNPSFENPTDQPNHSVTKIKKSSNSRNSRIHSVSSSAFSKYSVSKSGKISTDDDEEGDEIFTYAYPPYSTSPIAVDVRVDSSPDPTPITSNFNNQVGNDYSNPIIKESNEHVMIDVDLGNRFPDEKSPQHQQENQVLVGFSNTEFKASSKTKKPLSFLPRQKPPPSSMLSTGSLPDIPTQSNFTNPPERKKPRNKNHRKSSSMKYTNSNSEESMSESLLPKNPHDSKEDQSKNIKSNHVTNAGTESDTNTNGYVKTLNDDDEDGEISSIATNGKRVH
ncbi:uncharacterized protein MELLADRAFT_95627 [Melampsora larici-populina 98AG31]|uniref:Uncharacterized protein n=1 Tax=Melampsora larici-populina (strain 98AG31 / pathotype 3-4-7) TaxID=747676 RepID=F4SA06_MELLP|nr:uncharacterized protein MELLADRAFT_95627 [Melampsora larici-populina 98AG31]EGF98520.1 hypothetical protein MELLADRAFT_95627 [Melampsora larici-populina 98AG31]